MPNPFPLTLLGMMAMLGPQAINFGISVGGGEAYLLPNIGARGTFHMHWLMMVSVVFESALVYECIKYSMNTGRSFFAATVDLSPKGFWPWYWSIITLLVAGWPAWMAGAAIAAQRFTGISTQTLLPGSTLPPQYIWAVIALLLVLVVFYLSDRTYDFLQRFFLFIMFANIILVVLIVAIAAKPRDYWDVLMGMLGITFLTQGGYPKQLPLTDALALFGQPGGSIMYVSFWVIGAGFAMGKFAGQVTGPLRPPENVSAEELRWDTSDAGERRKMKQWVKLGGYSLFLWWAFIGGIIMVYLYSVAGYAYLHPEFLRTGKVPTGADVAVQMATVAGGVLGGMAGWLMLLFIMVTLYDAQFPLYDTFIGRTTTDAIAATRLRQGRVNDFFHNLLPVGLREPAVPLLVLRGRDGDRPGRVLDGAADLAVHHLAGRLGLLPDQPGDRVHPDHADQQPAAPSGVPRRQGQHGPAPSRDGGPVGGRCHLAVRRRPGGDHPPLAGGRLGKIGGGRRGPLRAFLKHLLRPRSPIRQSESSAS